MVRRAPRGPNACARNSTTPAPWTRWQAIAQRVSVGFGRVVAHQHDRVERGIDRAVRQKVPEPAVRNNRHRGLFAPQGRSVDTASISALPHIVVLWQLARFTTCPRSSVEPSGSVRAPDGEPIDKGRTHGAVQQTDSSRRSPPCRQSRVRLRRWPRTALPDCCGNSRRRAISDDVTSAKANADGAHHQRQQQHGDQHDSVRTPANVPSSFAAMFRGASLRHPGCRVGRTGCVAPPSIFPAYSCWSFLPADVEVLRRDVEPNLLIRHPPIDDARVPPRVNNTPAGPRNAESEASRRSVTETLLILSRSASYR